MLKKFLNQQVLLLEEKEEKLLLELHELDVISQEINGLSLNDSEIVDIKQYVSGMKEKNQGSLEIARERLRKLKDFRKIMSR